MLLSLATSLSALAGSPSSPPDTLGDSLASKTVVVKGSRRDRPVREIAQKTEVVTRADIEMTPATDLSDLLKKTSDIDVIQYPGLLSGVGVRGFRPQYSGLNQRTLLLVDGHLAGATNMATIGLFDVDHVEVLKGPSSALFGPMAMGGVINVVTTKAVTRPYVQLGAGSFGWTEAGFGAGGRDTSSGVFWDAAGRVMNQGEDYRIGRNHLLKDWLGWDENLPTTASGQVKVDSGDGVVRPFTSYQEGQGAVSLGWSRGPWYVRSRLTAYDAPSVESPGDLANGTGSQGLKNLERYSADLVARGRFGDHAVTLQGFRSREYSENWYTGTKSYRYYDNTIDWMGVQARDNLSLGAHSLVFGADWNTRETATEKWTNSITRTAPYSPDYAIHDVAGYAEGTVDPWKGLLIATAGLRYDLIGFETRETEMLPSFHPETRWFHVLSPSAGLVSLLPMGLRAHASFGRGFVTPDAFQVAGYSVTTPNAKRPGQVAVTYGNSDLDPESNWTVDGGLGLELAESGIRADVTVFGNFVQDKIASRVTRTSSDALGYAEGDTIASATRYVNADEATYRGVELSGSWDVGKPFGWRWGARVFGNSTIYTTLDEVTWTPSKDGLRDSVKTTADAMNVGTNWTGGIEFTAPDRSSVRLSSRYVGRRKDTDWTDATYPVIRYPAFLVTDVTVQVPVAQGTRLTLAVNNLSDENYYEKRGYNMPGRNWKISARHEF